MRKMLLMLGIVLAASAVYAATPTDANWRTQVTDEMPLLGHRNWILVVDSAYPLEISPGVQTIETDAPQLEVARFVLGAIENSIHVAPDIYVDAELPFVSDQDAPDASAYRRAASDLLHNYQIVSEPHEKLLARIADAGNTFRVLVLKTNGTVPYSSIFIRLDCKYWPSDAEQRLRARMAGHTGNQ
jgi:hypothetical protein